MSSFFFALIAVAIAGLGGRDQLLVARLAGRLGQAPGLLLVGCAVAIISSCAMAAAGYAVAGMLSASGKVMLMAFALLAAAFEAAWPRRDAKLREPTRSLGAAAVVLLFRQFTDAARFLVFALAVGQGSPWLVAAGGALGGCVALGLAWMLGEHFERQVPLRPIRLILATLLGVSALVIGLSARGVL